LAHRFRRHLGETLGAAPAAAVAAEARHAALAAVLAAAEGEAEGEADATRHRILDLEGRRNAIILRRQRDGEERDRPGARSFASAHQKPWACLTYARH
jgi:hypothetical protein